MQFIKVSPVSVVAAIALAGFAPSAFAYLDPSTGSMILSAIVGLFATVGLALKTYWYKLKSLLRGDRADSSVETRAEDSVREGSGNTPN